MDYIPDLGSDGSDNSEFCFCFWVGNCDWHRIGVFFFSLSLFIGRQLALFQRSGRCIYPFILSSFYFYFLLFFSCILLAIRLAWTLRSGQPPK
jgi:hypothetical protein